MATSPRAGIINLDFKDMSGQARYAQANDPFRLTLGALGDTAQILADRDRHIKYKRELAKLQGIDLPEDEMGTTTGEGISKGFSWLGNKIGEGADYLGGAIDTGVQAIKRKMLAPDMEGYIPSDATDAGKAQAQMQGYNPISEESKAIEGYKPIDMEGYNPLLKIREPSSLKSPIDDIQMEQEPSQETSQETSQEPTVVEPMVAEPTIEKTTMKSPTTSPALAWSEMYRLDPNRATFDWNRVAPKGSGAAGTVQARLEHDSALDQEIAAEAIQLRKDMITNGWTSNSEEFLSRYANILDLEAKKFVKGNKNELAKMIGLSDKEADQINKAEKLTLDKDKEQTKIDKEAYDVVKDVFDNLMDKKYTTPAAYASIAGDLKLASETGNIAAIKKAVKAFIQSIDNSVVMSFEARSFADQSKLGELKSWFTGLLDDNIYSPERLAEIWNAMKNYIDIYNASIDNLVSKGNKLYTVNGGKKPETITALGDMLKAPILQAAPDFSKIKAWWERESKGASGKPTGKLNTKPTSDNTKPESGNTGVLDEEDIDPNDFGGN